MPQLANQVPMLAENAVYGLCGLQAAQDGRRDPHDTGLGAGSGRCSAFNWGEETVIATTIW